ncbi:2Fe-2S iron-sulfur cluster binding domain-containing protein [Haloterrigena sp. SYSU A558-1]|uniref:2Fe-2S iron-sulfur cluster binding domain-containing protein n=1 Tax=Haloterrigena gelatinilytica TaxID=2741724 RepID=A0ABX2LFR2_9EURY|nr:2Fe-2S iron-sulfur cluster-binding protein [Haloterrigena gelatinilytica]NUC74218.1 2Fe-2S iron-sulfur cluster binding domain-containing protein [Haloterrigena gelatinilytica]
MAKQHHDVTLEWPDADRETRTVAVDEDETVLEAAERADIALPFGCRTGACGTCTGRLLEADGAESAAGDDERGTIDVTDAFSYRRSPRALKDRHRADGYVLLCIASPRVGCRLAVGASVHTELVDNPWK